MRGKAGKDAVPDDLFPNQSDRAREILGKLCQLLKQTSVAKKGRG
jgi:hypothetical protein